eukprot:GHVS01053745.1.p1 GENE.GHVS01053745.1~~GHVS01053745.1.p1  ORF type:complete len:235 (-),score=56.39 GHVS01053745.1:339-1043(-)
MLTRGLVSEKCFPYAGSAVSCLLKCSTDTPMKISSYCRVSGEKAIMGEIVSHGPVVGMLMLLDDFMVYSAGVYSPLKTAKRLLDTDKNLVLHAVKIIGWGSERGLPYWLVENCFGEGWGEKGFAKITRRQGNLFVDGVVMAATPDMNSSVEEQPISVADKSAEVSHTEDTKEEDGNNFQVKEEETVENKEEESARKEETEVKEESSEEKVSDNVATAEEKAAKGEEDEGLDVVE